MLEHGGDSDDDGHIVGMLLRMTCDVCCSSNNCDCPCAAFLCNDRLQ